MTAGSVGGAVFSGTPETVIASGFAYPEGPAVDRDGVLHVVELAAGTVSRVVDGRRVVLATVPGSPNGAAFDDDGVLWFCNNGGNWGPNASTGGVAGVAHRSGSIQTVDPAGVVRTVVRHTEDGGLLFAPNDLALDPDGGVWFTDPQWAARDEHGSAAAADSPPGRVCWAGRTNRARVLVDGLAFPNGLGITPAGDALVVGETGTGRLIRYPIVGRGALGAPSLYADLGPGAFPDGMAFDAAGRLVVAGTGSGSLFVVDTDGRLERTISMADIDVTNVCFAGEDGRDLIVTEAASGRVVTLRWDVAGHRLPVGPCRW